MNYSWPKVPLYELTLIALAKNPELNGRIMPEGGGIYRSELYKRIKDKLPIKYTPLTVQRELERLESIGPLKLGENGRLIWNMPFTPLRLFVNALRDRFEDSDIRELERWAQSV